MEPEPSKAEAPSCATLERCSSRLESDNGKETVGGEETSHRALRDDATSKLTRVISERVTEPCRTGGAKADEDTNETDHVAWPLEKWTNEAPHDDGNMCQSKGAISPPRGSVSPRDDSIAMIPARHWTELPVTVDNVSAPPDAATELVPDDKLILNSHWKGVVLCVMLVVVGVLGGVCGSGNCQTQRQSSRASLDVPTTAVGTSPSPVWVRVDEQPSLQPSFGYDLNETVPFTSTAELYRAVDEYLALGGAVGDNTSRSRVVLKYGFPIGAWDVSRLSNFSRVFDPDRSISLRETSRPDSSH